MRFGKVLPAVSLLALSVVATGCEEALGPSSEDPQVTLSFEVPAVAGISASRGPGFSAAAAEAVLKVDSVQLVLAQIKLHRAGDSADCDRSPSCESFRAGPVLVNLPLTGGRITPFAAIPPAGSYDRLEFKVHRPEGSDSVTQAFRTQYASWPATAAIRVVGTYNEKKFETYFRTEAKIRQEFEEPLVIDSTTKTDALGLTVSVGVDRWFVDGRGGVINPAELTTSPKLLALVEKNIRESFRIRQEKGRSEGRGKSDDKGKGKGKG